MKYKLAIFDFDGTLADSFRWTVSISDGIAEKYNLEKIDPNKLEILRGYDTRQLVKHYRVRWWKLPSMARDVNALMFKDAHKIPLFEGVGDVLRELSELGITLALVTSNTLENAQTILGPVIFNYFSYHECGVSIFGKSPKFKKILHKSGFLPAETVSIGDEIRDIQAAQKAKITPWSVAWGYARVDSLEAHAPDHIFTSMAEIPQKLMR